jgi:hypothetical protein
LVLSSYVNFVILLLGFFEHSFVFSLILLLNQKCLLICLSPHSNCLICPDSDEKVADARNIEGPNFAEKLIKHENFVICVAIEEFHRFIFGTW